MPNPLRFPVLIALAACVVALSACQTTPDHEEAYDPEKQGIAERVRHYRGEVAKSPEDAELHYRLGNALLDMGRHSEAYTAYQRAIALKPEYASAYANLGLTLRKMGNLKAAAGAYARALDIDPSDKTTLNNLATVAELMEDWARMAWCYGELLALEPANMDYAGAYAALLYGLENYEAAIPVYRKLIAAGQEPDANNYRLGFCYFSLNLFPDAISAWEEALTLAPESASVNRGLVAAYASAGNATATKEAVARCAALGIALDETLQQQVDELLGTP